MPGKLSSNEMQKPLVTILPSVDYKAQLTYFMVELRKRSSHAGPPTASIGTFYT